MIAKTAALKAGWDVKVAGVQINRFCASGLEAVNMAAQKVASGWEDLVVAGGVESMSRVPIGSDGGAWSQDPATNFATGFVPAGHRRRPDRHARRLGPRRRRPLRARPRSSAPPRRRRRAASTSRCCAVDDEIGVAVLEQRRVHQAAHDARGPRPAQGRVRRARRDGLRRGRARALPAGRAHRARPHRRQLVGHRRRCGRRAGRQRGDGPLARPRAARRASSRRRSRAPTRRSCSPGRCRRRARRSPRPA